MSVREIRNVVLYGMLLHCLAGTVPPAHGNVAAQHVINMPTNMTPVYVHHHPGNVLNMLAPI